MLALYSAKYEDIPKNEGPDEWYLVHPKSSGAANGETGCNRSHTQVQKPVVNSKKLQISCHFIFTSRTKLELAPFM